MTTWSTFDSSSTFRIRLFKLEKELRDSFPCAPWEEDLVSVEECNTSIATFPRSRAGEYLASANLHPKR